MEEKSATREFRLLPVNVRSFIESSSAKELEMTKFPWSAILIGATSILITVPLADAGPKVNLSGIRRFHRLSPFWAMQYHNNFRERHCVPSASYSPDLHNAAQAWANTCLIRHSGVPGENLYAASVGTRDDAWNAAVNWWYNEINNYNFNNPGFSTATGHFTQVIWRGTTQIGCGRAVCDGRQVNIPGNVGYWVCRYNPPGNYLGQFPANVPPRCK
jgi:hypothetical protein